MIDFTSPQSNDVVLSNSKGDRGLVLGGIEGVKQRLSSDVEAVRIEALSQASQYGREGLDLIIKAFHEDTEAVRRGAYFCLRDRQTPEIRRILQGYYPWDWKSCKNLFTYPIKNNFFQYLVISKNGLICAFHCMFLDDRKKLHCIVKILDLLNLRKIRTLTGFKSIPKLAITTDGQTLITGEYGGNITAWNTQTGAKLFSRSVGAVTNVAIGDDNETLVFSTNLPVLESERVGWETQVEIWNLPEQKRLKSVSIGIDWEENQFNQYGNTHFIDLSPHNEILLCQAFASQYDSKPVDIWNIAEGRNRKSYTLKFPKYYRNKCFAIAPNGLYFATPMTYTSPYIPNTSHRLVPENSRDRTVRDRAITLWKLHKDPEIDLLEKSSGDRNDAYESIVREKQFLGLLQDNGDITCLAFSPDGKILAVGSHPILDGEVKLWDLESRKKICTLTRENSPIKFVGFNQDGNILYTATQNNLKAWGF
ncbi:MAG: hypothetical protein AAGA60_17025 [Cyanobacteria bacterium P01_E01_bin.42]